MIAGKRGRPRHEDWIAATDWEVLNTFRRAVAERRAAGKAYTVRSVAGTCLADGTRVAPRATIYRALERFNAALEAKVALPDRSLGDGGADVAVGIFGTHEFEEPSQPLGLLTPLFSEWFQKR
jgi:hypothetical protein